jgi:hypothetical protein
MSEIPGKGEMTRRLCLVDEYPTEGRRCIVAGWRLKAAVLVVAMLVALGGWQGYKGMLNPLGEAHAQAVVAELPHFKCYVITPGTSINETGVILGDQFHPAVPTTGEGGESVAIRASQLVCTQVSVKCRTVDGAVSCEVPPTLAPLSGLDHLKCHNITPSGPPVNLEAALEDQFSVELVRVRTPQFLCAPASKDLTP